MPPRKEVSEDMQNPERSQLGALRRYPYGTEVQIDPTTVENLSGGGWSYVHLKNGETIAVLGEISEVGRRLGWRDSEADSS